jgi:hypothetical protein
VGIPLADKGHQAISQLSAISEVTDLKPLALYNTEPLLDLVHPGTVCWQKVTVKAGVSGKPGPNTFALMDAGVIETQEKCTSPRRESPGRA